MERASIDSKRNETEGLSVDIFIDLNFPRLVQKRCIEANMNIV